MSQRDREFLDTARLSITAAATVLGVTPQAVSQGLQRDADYIKGQRLQKLFDQVVSKDPSATSALIPYLKDAATPGESAPRIEKIRVQGIIKQYKISRLWIFSSSPLELLNVQRLRDSEDEFYSDPDFSIVYFVPPRVSLKLRGLLTNVLSRMLTEQNADDFPRLAHIEIIECPAVDLAPHFAIANPLPTSDGRAPSGAVFIGDHEEEAPLPDRQVQNILQVLLANGIGVDSRHTISSGPPLTSSPAEWTGLEFRSIFSSRDLEAQFVKQTKKERQYRKVKMGAGIVLKK